MSWYARDAGRARSTTIEKRCGSNPTTPKRTTTSRALSPGRSAGTTRSRTTARRSRSDPISAPRARIWSACCRGPSLALCLARDREETRDGLALHVDGVAFQPYLIGRDVTGDGTAEQLTGADVEARVVQRTLDHVPHELAGRERRARVPADVAQRVECAPDVPDQHALAIDDDPLHRAGRQLGGRGHRHEAFDHAARRPVPPAQWSSKPNMRAAFSEVIFFRSGSGTPANMRVRKSRDFGHVDSACGKSLPHSMVSTPISSRSLTPRSSSMNSTNMLRRQ